MMPYQMPPPTAPIEKAPPKSLRMTHGLRIQVSRAHRKRAGRLTRDRECGRRGPYFIGGHTHTQSLCAAFLHVIQHVQPPP